jgi:putative CocE/NonD family hydrolase
MTNSIRIDQAVPIEMRDGTVLRGDVYRFNDRQKRPAILARTRYNRREDVSSAGWNPFSSFMPVIDAVNAGYAFIIQNIRGTYDSGGEQRLDDPFLTVERQDGYDSIEWAAVQPWCDGNVGMAGASLLGSVQWVAAMENPPHLKAIAPWASGSGLLPTRFNGTLNLVLFIGHLLLDGLELADKLEKEGRDVTRMREIINDGWWHPEKVYNYLPLKDVPQADFDVIREYWQAVLNPSAIPDDSLARPGYSKITVPCLHVSGWYDFFIDGTFGNFNSMREKGGSLTARQGQHVLMGPWNHLGPNVIGETGEIFFGQSATITGSPIIKHNLAFFDKYLKGKQVELPAVHYFVMGGNSWRSASGWPLPQTNWQRLYFHSQGQANSASGNGLLDFNKPGAEKPDVYFYDPLKPVFSTGFRGCGDSGFASSPKNQYFVEQRDDVLCYTTSELKEDIEVTGPLSLHLFASSSAVDTDFVAKLVDVYPSGYTYDIADGIIRARYRKSFVKPDLITPGEVYEYVINLGGTSNLFREGHRIRIDIASSNFPEYDRNMNTGNPPGEDAKGIIAKQSIYHNSEYASYIDLPVISIVK